MSPVPLARIASSNSGVVIDAVEEDDRSAIRRKVGDHVETRDFFVLKGMKDSEAKRLAEKRPLLLWHDEEMLGEEKAGVAIVNGDF